MSVDERYKFVRSKKLCINCLTPNHFVKDCPKKSFCRIQDCPAKHSTFLHLKDKKPANDEAKGAEEDRNAGAEASNNGYVTAVSSRTSNSKEASTTGLAVVLVKVRAKGGNKLVKTYAFLDSGSKHHLLHRTTLERTRNKGNQIDAITDDLRDC